MCSRAAIIEPTGCLELFMSFPSRPLTIVLQTDLSIVAPPTSTTATVSAALLGAYPICETSLEGMF